MHRRFALVTASVAVALAPLACSSAEPGTSSPTPAPGEAGDVATPVELTASGTLAPPSEAANAYTYDPALAPPGAQLTITLVEQNSSTEAKLDVAGLQANRGYAVHLHTNACGSTGDAAGPHFQHRVDPAATPEEPSTNPEYANPDNEIWLDLRTDAAGSATSSDEVPFVFTDRRPGSVVVHEEMMTATARGEAGTAGNRVACLTLPDQ